ncbi:MAG: hypothetical protein K8S99_13680 [Planctomycetes bacterium]|nr:hypothetical protein [Planctomycetota bacterium]
MIAAASEQAALLAFTQASERVPAYRKILAAKGIDVGNVVSIRDFENKVPLLNKALLFGSYDLPSLCVNGSLEDAAAVYTSSGFSSTFSWGVETASDEEKLRFGLDLLLETYFSATEHRTLLINALPMGVKVPARLPIVLDTGPRADSCLAAVKTIGPHVDQILLVGEHPFLKKLAEDGATDPAVNWPSRRVFVITGGEWIACGYPAYLGKLLGQDPDNHIKLSLGVSEIGLNVGIETPDARHIRRLLHADPALSHALLGDAPFTPVVTQYMPDRLFIESPEIGGVPRLVVTTLDLERRLPLVRYCTEDWARVIPFVEMCETLTKMGHGDKLPRTPLPFIAMFGRGKSLAVGEARIYPEQIKELFYADPNLAGAITGDFRMEASDGQLRLRVQLRREAESNTATAGKLESAIVSSLHIPARVTSVPYAGFVEGLDVGYQRKFRYLP